MNSKDQNGLHDSNLLIHYIPSCQYSKITIQTSISLGFHQSLALGLNRFSSKQNSTKKVQGIKTNPNHNPWTFQIRFSQPLEQIHQKLNSCKNYSNGQELHQSLALGIKQIFLTTSQLEI